MNSGIISGKANAGIPRCWGTNSASQQKRLCGKNYKVVANYRKPKKSLYDRLSGSHLTTGSFVSFRFGIALAEPLDEIHLIRGNGHRVGKKNASEKKEKKCDETSK